MEWRIDDEHIYIDDGLSGASELRKLPAKRKLLDLIASGKAPFQRLVTQAPDRPISRAGIDVWFYSDRTRFEDGTFATNTLAFLKAEFAAEYRRAISAKTARRCVGRRSWDT